MGQLMRWYGRFLARYFYLVIIIISIVCATLLATALFFGTEPDFSNPDLGFETRGTDLAGRVITWRNLEEAVKRSTILSSKPTGFRGAADRGIASPTIQRGKRDSAATFRSKKEQQYFCGEPGPDYSRIVVRGKSPFGLFNVDALKEICELGDIIGSAESLKQICQYSNSEETTCCPPWSLGSYVAELRSTKCSNLTETDVSAVLDLLRLCLPYFTNGKLLVCAEGPCDNVPERCSKNNYVFDILFYLTDNEFLRGTDATLHYSVLFLPVAASTETSDFFFEAVSGRDFGEFDRIQLVGVEFGLKWWLFEFYLLRDTIICVGLASSAVFFCLWGYSGSFSLSFSTMTSGTMSLAVAYFAYAIVFSIDFFPYINLMAAALAMAVVADDSFILWAAWKRSKKANGRNGDLPLLVSEAVSESWLPCSVTSLTTAGALYSSFISSITAVKCFSVFAGTAVVVNLILTLTWLPAWLVLDEKLSHSVCKRKKISKARDLGRARLFKSPRNFFARIVDYFFTKILPAVLIRCRYAWIILFGLLSFACVVVVTYYPGLRLPHSSEFQLFDLSHPFERYSFVLKKFLPFEEEEERYSASLPIRFVWGVKTVDEGNHLDPNDWGHGSVVLDEKFNMSSPESQVFLLDFCQDLRQQAFYLETPGAMIPNCFIESFKNYFMGRDCIDEIERVNFWPCCQDTRFPYKPRIFDNCVAEGVGSLYEAQNKFFGSTPAGPKFVSGANPPQIGAVVVEYSSVYNFTFDHGEMKDFYQTVQTWFEGKSKEAPVGMRNGWFVSDLEFYDLQNSLITDTYLTIATDMGIAFVVLLMTTQEPLLSFLCILTVSSVIFCTVAVLTVFGWTLNILESAIVSLAIGLAVDFTLHYGIAYRTSMGQSREAKVEAAVKSVGVPVAMGALTTFLAGLAMLPSRVLAHVQIGIFLVVLMATSWALSTFFLVPLLGAFGRVGIGCRLPCSRGKARVQGRDSHIDLNSISELDQTFESFTLRPAIVPQSHLVLGKTTRV